jgi:hypothetical protein
LVREDVAISEEEEPGATRRLTRQIPPTVEELPAI